MTTIGANSGRCTGCKRCERACAAAHPTSPHPRIHIGAIPGAGKLISRCLHCDPAPCQHICPRGAITRDPETSLVLLDGRKCISCVMCAMVCPTKVLTWHLDRELNRTVAHKCDGCLGETPACVKVCKARALFEGGPTLEDFMQSAA